MWCAGCYYKGVTYQEKQVWEDGCDYVCECIDGTTGRYSCSEKSAYFLCVSVMAVSCELCVYQALVKEGLITATKRHATNSVLPH